MPLLIAAAALVTHPLLGMPLLITSIVVFFLQKTKCKRIILLLLFIAIAVSAPALFALNNLRVGVGWPTFTNPLANIDRFVELFERPYWYLKNAPLMFEVLYGWERLIVPVVVGLALLGIFLSSRAKSCHATARRDEVERSVAADASAYENATEPHSHHNDRFLHFARRLRSEGFGRNDRNARPARAGFASLRMTKYQLLLFPTISLALFIGGWLLRNWIVFPDVVAYEQGDFPLRLIRASLIFLLPFAIYGLFAIFEKLNKIYINSTKLILLNFVQFILIPLVLMLSFYLSYPQRNIKARFPGYNITASDFKAVEWIHNRHSDYNYIVLSNQLVSAAALTNYSFAKYFPNGIFYYALPTGGPQYQDYGRMLYEGQKREYMLSAMDRVGADTGYFVINKYWANSDKIIESAKLGADDWEVVDDGRVWVFVYKK